MNYLQLCQFAHRYIGGGNDLPGTAPLTVVGQKGYLYEIVKSVADAYEDIQNSQDSWTWTQKQTTILLPMGKRILSVADITAQIPTYDSLMPDLIGSGFRYVLINRVASGVAGQTPATYVPYQTWRGLIDRNIIPTAQPYLYTIQPDGSLEFNSIADQDYTITCDYKLKLDEWAQSGVDPDAQIPILPKRYHKVIGWRAVMYWAGTVESPGKYGFAKSNYDRMMRDMLNNCLPEMLLDQGAYYNRYPMVWY